MTASVRMESALARDARENTKIDKARAQKSEAQLMSTVHSVIGAFCGSVRSLLNG